jgi:tetratricopeptide (TPR) repeat protein
MRSPAFNLRNLVILVGLLMAGAVLANSFVAKPARKAEAAESLANLKPNFGPKNFTEALKAATDQVELAQQRIGRSPGDWLNQESFARASMARFRLTGNYADLSAAQNALDRADKSTTAGTGPLLTDAIFAATSHKLGRLRLRLNDLDAVVVPLQQDKAETLALQGDLAFYSGRYKAALDAYLAAAALADGPGISFRLGRYHQRTGDSEAALQYFALAASKTKQKSPMFLSSVWLQIGTIELERGNWEVAESHFKKADEIFPGYWLNQAHLAQMRAVRGDITGAKAAYLKIANQSSSPESMDALAALYRSEGDSIQSRYWSGKSAAIWSERLNLLPEAAYGHAFDHQILFGRPEVALDLARRNFASRPYGDSAVLLASAHLANGNPAQAQLVLEPLGKTRWRGAQQHAALSATYAMLGQEEASEREREKALVLNPKIFDPAAPFIWFGHH